MGRAPCCDKANVKRGPWSPEEDAALRSYIETHGTGGNWIALPHKAGLKRCGKSCRLRWLNYLRPDIKHGNFSEEEDTIICSLYKNIGSRWSVIASHLPGRTDNDVKNYWNTKLKKRVINGTPPPSIVPTVKTEDYTYSDFSQAHGLNSSTAINQDCPPRFFSELPPFPMLGGLVDQPDYSSNVSGYGVSPSEDISAASSTVTMDNASGSMNWPIGGGGGGAEDVFLAELGFGSFTEFLSGYDTLDNMGNMGGSAPSLATLWTSPDQSNPQEITFS